MNEISLPFRKHVLIKHYTPLMTSHLSTNLVTTLTGLKMNNFTHFAPFFTKTFSTSNLQPDDRTPPFWFFTHVISLWRFSCNHDDDKETTNHSERAKRAPKKTVVDLQMQENPTPWNKHCFQMAIGWSKCLQRKKHILETIFHAINQLVVKENSLFYYSKLSIKFKQFK